jgi:hypothetical protein
LSWRSQWAAVDVCVFISDKGFLMTKAPKEIVGEGIRAEELVGKVVVFHYPHTTDRRVERKRYEPRRLKVEQVRDPRLEPLDPQTFVIDPYTRRDGLLLAGVDLDSGRQKRFWTGSMVGARVVPADSPEAIPSHTRTVFIVDRPRDWSPQSAADLPPDVERHERPSPDLARTFARHFNEMEMSDPTGHWAMV